MKAPSLAESTRVACSLATTCMKGVPLMMKVMMNTENMFSNDRGYCMKMHGFESWSQG
jgi:hypothetical protein